MLKIELPSKHVLNEEDFVILSPHAHDRRAYRDGLPVGVSVERIERIGYNNFHRMKPFYGRVNKFVLISYRDEVPLNIVGEVFRDGDDWLFKVATVMKKRGFVPKPGTHAIRVNESREVMVFESFMQMQEDVLELNSGGSSLFGHQQTSFVQNGGSTTHTWMINVNADGIDDEIMLTIEHIKDPRNSKNMDKWMGMFEDVAECLSMLDGGSSDELRGLHMNFDQEKWSKALDIAEVSMKSRRTDYEMTGYGKSVALKLLRTRFRIISDWVNENEPSVFLSNPKKEEEGDSRRLRIYEGYFKNALPGYEVFTKERMEEPTDLLVCVDGSISQRQMDVLEQEVESAVHR